MPSSYPGAADSFGAPAGSDPQSTPVGGRTHSQSHTDLGDAVEAIEAELGLNPSGAAATVAARLDAHDASTTPHLPAGAVSGSGAVGAVKWDESVGRRCFVWDTTNSRWQMTYGDTGSRYVTDWFSNGWNLNYTASGIRRYGNVVDMWIILNAANATARAALTLPLGFRPANLRYTSAIGYLDPPGPVNLTEIDTDGVLSVWGYTTTPPSGSYYMSGTWTTNDPWPTVLPGTASGGIPSA